MNSELAAPFAAMLALAAVALWWYSAIQARDRARDVARAFCRRQGWQLLDHTVALARFRPRRTDTGWMLIRVYRFDFSPDGGRRLRGELTLNGNRPVRIVAETDNGDLIEERPAAPP